MFRRPLKRRAFDFLRPTGILNQPISMEEGNIANHIPRVRVSSHHVRLWRRLGN